jgi:protein-S-isoprenylcysteine O-methyltransferase Ste14
MTRTNALFRWLLSNAVLATLAFLCASTTDLFMLTAYLGTIAALSLVTTLIVDPTLLHERSTPGPGVLDPFVGIQTSFLFLLTVAVATLDSGRLHWSESITQPVQVAALVLLVVMTALQTWAMVVNPFFSSAIRLQTERGHHLISSGPYRLVRHPGYSAMLLIMPATAIALGSCLALVPAFLYSAVILRRTTREDFFLKSQLTGYPGYMSRVRYRLFPGLW